MKRASSSAPAGLNVKKITAYLKGQAKNRNAVRITCQGGSVYIITGYAAFKLPAALYPEVIQPVTMQAAPADGVTIVSGDDGFVANDPHQLTAAQMFQKFSNCKEEVKRTFLQLLKFISPRIPSGCVLAGKQFDSRHIAQQFHNTLSGFIRFYAVRLYRGFDYLVHCMAFDQCFCLESRRHSQQANLCICTSVSTHSIKVSARLVFFDPDECRRFVCKAPCVHNLQRIWDGWECRPHEQRASLPPRKLANGQCANVLNGHCVVVLRCVPAAFWSSSMLAVTPRRICVDHRVLLFRQFHF